MDTSVHTVTADQLYQIPDDGFRYELVRGELRKMTPSGFNHGKVVANLTGPLTTYVKAHRLGVVCGAETGFKIGCDPDTVLAPDVAFVRKERLQEVEDTERFWPGTPDLAVEVLSPSDTAYDVEEKVTTWLAAGAAMVWLVNPKQHTIHIYRSNKPVQTLLPEDVLEGSDVIPGFRLSVTELFS
jgi:Uma2 family endonuclease